MFNLKNLRWTSCRTIKLKRQEEQIQPRRNHAAVMFGSKMLIYGGISQDREYLSDVWEFYKQGKVCVWLKRKTKVGE
jgi:hypothetical protein